MANQLRTMAHNMLLVVLYLGHMAVGLSAEDPVIYSMSMQESHPHELYVSWNVTDDYLVQSYSVTHQKKESQAITYSGPLYNATDGYLIIDLVSETEYEVCLTITLADSDICEKSEDSCKECLPMSTIPLLRDDSLIALILTLGVILGLIIIGLICWHCAKKRMEENDEEEGSEHGSDESKQPILLSVPAENGPRRSVDFEDQDIPYIDEHGEPISKDYRATHI